MKFLPLCSVPGCRNLSEPQPRLCKEHRRSEPRTGHGSWVGIGSSDLMFIVTWLEINRNRMSVVECAEFLRKKAIEVDS